MFSLSPYRLPAALPYVSSILFSFWSGVCRLVSFYLCPKEGKGDGSRILLKVCPRLLYYNIFCHNAVEKDMYIERQLSLVSVMPVVHSNRNTFFHFSVMSHDTRKPAQSTNVCELNSNKYKLLTNHNTLSV